MRVIFVIALFGILARLSGQTLINGGRTVTGSWDASQAAASKPAKMGTVLPAACGTGEFFFLSTATAGKNLYLCTATNTWTQVAPAGSGGGSGSAAVTGGAIATAPACTSAAAGTIFFGDDSPYETWCNGTVWKYRFNGSPATPADDSTFAWVNQGSATSTVSGGVGATTGVVGVNAPAGGSAFNPRMRMVPVSATAMTATAVLAPMSIATAGSSQGGVGLVIYNSSHFVTCEFKIAGLPGQALMRLAIYGSVFPNPFQIVSSSFNAQWFPGSPLWLKLQTADSTSFTGYLSTDHGMNWQPIGTIALGGAEVFTKAGWFVTSDSSDHAIVGSLLSWNLTTP